ncbi:helix-turn-helix domain-containing protein [Kribbella sp. NPDC050124]|uniref:helix-turn-helix domain-containing protein n=1 Tax=Kribbella sp. NPDC050124 TaxID=3364114 RepID=UPI0037B97138
MATQSNEFELTFEVSGVDETVDEALSADFDVMVGVSHDGTEFVTATIEADSAVEAARSLIASLHSLEVTVHRLREDLVTRKDIAERAGVTPQAVGYWIRGDRAVGATFPAPYNPVAGGVYLWSEVNSWLRDNGKDSDDWEFPSRADIICINADLLDWLRLDSEHDQRTRTASATVTWVEAVPAEDLQAEEVQAPLSKRFRVTV